MHVARHFRHIFLTAPLARLSFRFLVCICLFIPSPFRRRGGAAVGRQGPLAGVCLLPLAVFS
jgi:hypothetical protein